MSKVVKLDPLNLETLVQTNENILSALLKNDLNVLQECGGQGRCATCHVYVKDGVDSLAPMNRREQRTLEVITTCKKNSRLACQARILGEGVVVEVPSGMYLNSITDMEALIGRRAEQDILHPISAKVLVPQGKLITRITVEELKAVKSDVGIYLAQST